MTDRPARPDPPPANPAPDAAAAFDRLVRIVRTLRGPGGCPWDREQTLESLRQFVLEEAYEVVGAIDRGDTDGLRSEIGDLIFEGVLLAQICSEDGRFDVADALRAVADKLVRRHPHVFAPADAPALGTAAEVLEHWERLKDRERDAAGERRAILAGVPPALPALLRAFQIGSRVAAVGFDWSRAADVVTKIEEEVAELHRAIDAGDRRLAEEEMGDLLFAVANLSRKLDIEPEAALRRANDKFTRRFGELEAGLEARGLSVHDATLEQMEEEWQRVKGGRPR
jgi:MazG family protein